MLIGSNLLESPFYFLMCVGYMRIYFHGEEINAEILIDLQASVPLSTENWFLRCNLSACTRLYSRVSARLLDEFYLYFRFHTS